MKKCPYCSEEIQDEALKCKHCGEFLTKHCDNCESNIPKTADFCQSCGVIQLNKSSKSKPKLNQRNKTVAALLAIFLGDIGIHRFYLKQIGWGIIYLAFCWTFIPAIVGIIEGIILLVMEEDEFSKKYCN